MNGYMEGDRMLYVLPSYNHGKCMKINDSETWEEHCQSCNELFEEMLKSDKDYKRFNGKMFYIWEGNHHVIAWHRHIHRVHCENKE